jgi:hypothetical protein
MHTDEFKETPRVFKTTENSYGRWFLIAAMRYERMDEHMPTAFGDFATQQLQSTRLSQELQEPRPWGPLLS